MELEGKQYRMWAVKRLREQDQTIYYWGISPHKRYTECFVLKDGVLVDVEVTIDPQGTYWAMYRIKEDKINMIYPSKNLFDVCFPYGPEAEEKLERGKIVKCTVKEVN